MRIASSTVAMASSDKLEAGVAVPAIIGAALLLVVQDAIYLRANRPTEHERSHGILHVIEKDIEWPTLAFFLFLFIAVGAAVQTGMIDTLANGVIALVNAGAATMGLGPRGRCSWRRS